MMYSNNILNFQEPTTILKACTKTSGTYWMHQVWFIKYAQVIILHNFLEVVTFFISFLAPTYGAMAV